MNVGDFMTEQDFHAIRKLLMEHSAIVLETGKEYLVETRLAPLLRPRHSTSMHAGRLGTRIDWLRQSR